MWGDLQAADTMNWTCPVGTLVPMLCFPRLVDGTCRDLVKATEQTVCTWNVPSILYVMTFLVCLPVRFLLWNCHFNSPKPSHTSDWYWQNFFNSLRASLLHATLLGQSCTLIRLSSMELITLLSLSAILCSLGHFFFSPTLPMPRASTVAPVVEPLLGVHLLPAALQPAVYWEISRVGSSQ